MSLSKNNFGEENTNDTQPAHNENKTEGDIGNTILSFQSRLKDSIEWESLKKVAFAMWLPSENDKSFASSPIKEIWTAIYSITPYYWSYITADLLKTIKIVNKNTYRLGLPDNFKAFAILTQENEQIILSLTKEKGIRFHFAETTSLNYRLQFLDQFLSYCSSWEELIKTNNLKQDENSGFQDWWAFTVETSIALEEIEPLKGVGNITK